MTNRPADSNELQWREAFEWLTTIYAKDPTLQRRGRITATLLTATFTGALIFFAALIAVSTRVEGGTPIQVSLTMFLVIGVLSGLFYANRLGYVNEVGLLYALITLLSNFLLVDMTSTTLPGPAILIIPVLIAGLVGPPASAYAIAFLAVIGHLYVNTRADPEYFQHLGAQSQGLLNLYGQLFAAAFASWLFAQNTHTALAESTEFGLALSQQRERLEVRVASQSRYLQATTAIARAIVGLRDIDQLLNDAVDLIRDTFGYYHVQVFLVDEDRQYAVLRSSTGEAGRTLLDRGHRLPVGSLSVIGQVTAGGRLVVARDTDADAVHRRNELLPNTRSEMALPLVVTDRIVGALDLQSTEPDAFGEEVMPILQALADQLAIAIENARLFSQTQSSLRELEELYGDMTERSWADFLSQARDQEKRQVFGPESKTIEVQRSAVVKRVLGSGSVIISTGKDGRQSFLAAPIIVRNEIVGVLGVEPEGSREWTQDDIQLIQSIAERTALAAENARLYLQAQRAADRERLVNSIAGRLQRAPNLKLLLESAAEEIANALGTENVYAEISLDQPLGDVRKEISDANEPVEGQARPNIESEEARAKS